MLSPRWRKVLRDLWGNKARTILVVLAIAVGVFAFGGNFIGQEVLMADMRAGYESINPANINMTLTYFEDDLVNAVKGMRQVADAEGRAIYGVKVKAKGDKWFNLDLVAVQDYDRLRINRITPEEGAWPPRRRQVVLERTSLSLLDVEVGDTLLIELANGDQHEIEFAGTVHDFNSIPANLFPWLTGYVSMETLEWLGHPGMCSELTIITEPEYNELEEIEEVAAEVKERLDRDGHYVVFVEVVEPGKHWASDATQAIFTILGLIGSASLVLSGFLVVNTITAVLAQQKRQIGMMKAVGATGRQVAGIYVVMVLTFGLLSLVVAIPAGVGLAYVSTMAVANFLNLNITNFHLSPRVLILEVIIALIVPLVAAAVPIVLAMLNTVQEAVSDYGITLTRKEGLLDRLLARVRGLPRPTLLSLRNTFRRRGRLALTLITLSLAGAMFVGVVSVRDSLMIEMDRIMKLFNFDLEFILDGPYQVRRLEREAMRVPGITAVEGWMYVEVQRIRPDGSEGSTFAVFGPPVDTPLVEPTLLDGRWLLPDDKNAIVLSHDIIRDEPDIKVGDEITLKLDEKERPFRVVGIISEVGEAFAYADFDHLARLLEVPGQSYVLFAGADQPHQEAQTGLLSLFAGPDLVQETYLDGVSSDLEDRLKRAGIGVSQSLTRDDIIGANIRQFNFIVIFMLFMALLLAVVGGLGLAGTMSLNVLERTREIGVMRSIGAANGSVRSVVMVEGLLIGLISWAIGAILSIPASLGFSTAVGMAFMGRPLVFSFSIQGVIAWLILALAVAAVASLLPAQRATQISVRESLAYE